jgi:ankyrin repeat protein
MGACCSAVDKPNTKHTKAYKENKSNVQQADVDTSIDKKKSINNKSKNTAEAYIRTGDIVVLEQLINDGDLVINELNFDGGSKTALHVAIQNPNRSVVELFLNNKANVNIPELNTGNSALFMAAIDFKVEYVELLLKSNSLNFNLKNHNNKDILEFLEEFKQSKVRSGEDREKIDVIIRRIREAKERSMNFEVLDEPQRF